MKKNYLTIAAFLCVLCFAAAAGAGGHKYKKEVYTPPSPDELTQAESVTSLSDCMTFSANHKTKGKTQDEAEFKKQFGTPISAKGLITEYNYDQYTKVTLDCTKKSCSCRCLGRY